jgi:uncharacterized membrane protein
MATVAVSGQRPRSQAKLVSFIVFALVTVFVTFMKNRAILDASSEVARHFAPARLFLAGHAFFAGIAMLLGAFQFSNRLRARYLKLHKALGYVYVISVFVGAPLAIPLSAKIDTPSLTAASCVQAFGWMLCTGIALYCVRSGNIAQHRRWMLRGYPFAMVFTVARLLIPIPPILRSGFVGIEIVVWSAIALAAFLPSVLLEWRSIFPRPVARAAAASAD